MNQQLLFITLVVALSAALLAWFAVDLGTVTLFDFHDFTSVAGTRNYWIDEVSVQ